MSVQNGERLATKQDLADMYQGILPYLGGMPEMVANKFSKGDLYSTDEKMIGQWIDGKPLYAKTFVLATPISINANKWGDVVDITSLYVDELVEVSQARQATGNYLFSIFWNIENNILKAFAPSNNQSIKRFTIKYTKTTDSAISIGSDTDYSTEEKIVGTWIDGKPLYQKTIVGKTNSSINLWKTIGTISNMDIGMVVGGYVLAGNYVPIQYAGYGSAVVINANGEVNHFTDNSSLLNKDIYVIVQYTKTT